MKFYKERKDKWTRVFLAGYQQGLHTSYCKNLFCSFDYKSCPNVRDHYEVADAVKRVRELAEYFDRQDEGTPFYGFYIAELIRLQLDGEQDAVNKDRQTAIDQQQDVDITTNKVKTIDNATIVSLSLVSNPLLKCEHLNQDFDRTVSDCGWMHTTCTDCDTILDNCGCENNEVL
jgi:hypothetical protein